MKPATTSNIPAPAGGKALPGIPKAFTRDFWRQLWAKKRRTIIVGASIGIVIHVALAYAKPTRISQWIEDASVDWMIRVAGTGQSAKPNVPDLAFTFIDIDNKTLEDWPQVPYTPRNELLQLIRFAVDSKAKVVIVDVNLTHPINPNGKAPSGDDVALNKFLREYSSPVPATEGSQPCRRPKIILTQDFRIPAAGSTCLYGVPSFLKVDGSSGSVLFGSVNYEQGIDGVVRYWRLWERDCVLPYPTYQSVEWLAAQFVTHPEACKPAAPEEMNIDRRGTLAERILYTIRWDPDGEQPLSSGVPVAKISASEITRAKGRPLSGELVKDRVVVIGGSAEALRDMHLTPLGEMPGTLVLINSIYALIQNRVLRTIPVELEILCGVIFILLTSIVFALLDDFKAYLITGLVTAVVILPLSRMGFRGGYWLDFTVPLIAVQVHHMWAEFEHSVGRAKQSEP